MYFSGFNKLYYLVLLVLLVVSSSCINSNQVKKRFVDPPKEFKPKPFWHINGELTKIGIRRQLNDAKNLAGFSGAVLLPLASKENRVGTSPMFLSEEYFERYQDFINVAEELDMEIILYDDIDFPSGMAGGKMEKFYPNHTMKRLDKIDYTIKGPRVFSAKFPGVALMSAVASNSRTKERIEFSDSAKGNTIKWQVPAGVWNISLFPLVKDTFHKKYLCMDFMDTVAVRYMINQTYDKYYERFGKYFGNTIKTTFFDDVGFWRHPRSWTPRFNEKFIELNGFDPKPYYPVLWENVGSDTEALRYAFFNTRAELLAEGFPKLVAEWAKNHHVKDTGHPPGNYDPSPIDMNGDIFKFFRHTAIPLTDAIVNYNFGKDGHKLVSSAADYYDKPIVATEVFGAYKEAVFDSLMLYRSVMDLFARGVNSVVPHGMWYDPNKVYIHPLISPYSKKIGPALPAYSKYIGRTSMLLQGGRRVSEIGVLYPFEGLAGWFRFDNPENIRQGWYVSPETDYQTIGSWLSNDLRRDFTFVHPELFLDDKYIVKSGTIKLNNKENHQTYHTMILTGSKIISYKTLQKLRSFYDHGGTIVATKCLPFKSAEVGKDAMVIDMVKEIFGVDPLKQEEYTGIIRSGNFAKGKALFIPNPNAGLLAEALNQNTLNADVRFVHNPKILSDIGKFNVLHKVKDGVDIYYFSNSSDEIIETEVVLRGKLNLENWNPHNGTFSDVDHVDYTFDGINYFTTCNLKLEPVSSTFYIDSK